MIPNAEVEVQVKAQIRALLDRFVDTLEANRPQVEDLARTLADQALLPGSDLPEAQAARAQAAALCATLFNTGLVVMRAQVAALSAARPGEGNTGRSG